MSSNSHIFTQGNAEVVASCLVEHLCKNAGPTTVDYDYQISAGKMVDEGGDSNTTYKFDAEKGSLLREIIDTLYPEEADDRSEEDYAEETKWLNSIIEIINTKYIDLIRDAIRSKVFKNVQPELVPMNPFVLNNLEFSSVPEADFLIVVQRAVPKDQIGMAQSNQAGSIPINQELFNLHIQTGLSFDEIIAQKKAEGDPRYTTVCGATKRKYLYNVEMLFYVDYSLTPQEEFIRLLKLKEAQKQP